ncbi:MULTISPECIES: hypothetical protein [Mycobacteroides]|nr:MULTISPECIES: hypothetical protein [Mycobacteroides]
MSPADKQVPAYGAAQQECLRRLNWNPALSFSESGRSIMMDADPSQHRAKAIATPMPLPLSTISSSAPHTSVREATSIYSAKEAGMRAAQGVLTASNSPSPVPRIFEHFSLPRPIKWLWRPDDSTYAKGQRNVFDIMGS